MKVGRWVVLLASMLAAPAGAYVSSSTVDGQPAGNTPVYTLLIGQPHAPGLPPLSAVTVDVAMMHAFFGALTPSHSYVHLPPGDVRDELTSVDTTVGGTTWPEVEASVRAIAAAIDDRGPVDVYIYYAGHGRKRRVGAHTRTDLFLYPIPDADRPGDDGVLSTRLLHQRILAPLEGSEVRVHLIVDACQSAYLLESRGMRRTHRVFKAPPAVEPEMLEKFTGRHGHVGALLATSGSQVTYESAGSGGLFSYALRSAGIGAADLDRDGRITYRELDQVLPSILSKRAGGAVPTMLAPGQREGIFVDYRGRQRAVGVIFDPDQPIRYEIQSHMLEPYAAVYPDGEEPLRVYLPDGQPFLASARFASSGARRWYRFQAAGKPFDDLTRPVVEPRIARGGVVDEPPPLVLNRPLTPDTLVTVEDPQWLWMPEQYTTLAIAGLTEAVLYGRTLERAERSFAGGLEVSAALGEGPDQLTARVGYVRRFAAETFEHEEKFGLQTHRRGHLGRVDLGYSRVLAELALLELSGGGFVGGGLLFEEQQSNEVLEGEAFDPSRGKYGASHDELLPLAEGGLEFNARVLFPDSVWAVRADLRLSGQTLFGGGRTWTDLVVAASIGFEYEFVLR